ncbi:MAG: hypothetical protein KAS72_06545 [Phycisphaerales bacterium]|nr:hypothetical protein [Phycisphaerales bacterium]
MHRATTLRATCRIAIAGLVLSAASTSLCQERWVSHGPYGGSVSVLIESTQPGGGLYAGVLGHGVAARSGDTDTWIHRSDGLNNLFIQALVQNPDDPEVLYAGTRDGVYWTTDGGLHWEQRTEGIGATHIEAIAIDPTNPSVLYAENWGAVYKTVNAGELWEETGPGIPTGLACHAILVDPESDGVVYAAMLSPYGPNPDDTGVYKSTNGGGNWQRTSEGLLNTNVRCLTFDPTSSQIIYAGIDSSEYYPGGGVYVTYDGAVHWNYISEGLPTDIENVLNGIAVTYESAADVPVLYAAGSYGYSLPSPPGTWEPRLFKSVNGGASWHPSSTGFAYPNVLSILVDSHDPRIVYAGSECGGVFQSIDAGATWSHFSRGLQLLCVNSLAIDPEDHDTIYAAADAYMDEFSPAAAGVYVSFDGGLTWEPRPKNLKLGGSMHISSVAVAPADPQIIYAASFGWMMYKSIDQGMTWQWRGFPHGIDGFWLECVVVDPADPLVAYVSGGGFEPSYPDIYKTTDGGESWTPVASWIVWAEFMGLAIDPTDTRIVYAGTGWEGVFKTTNGGGLWTLTGPEILGARVGSLVVDPQNPPHVYAGDAAWESTGMYVSYNGGENWESYNEGLSSLSVLALAIDSPPGSSSDVPILLYAGTQEGGVFRRNCEGGDWQAINEGLGNRCVRSLAITPVGPDVPDPRRSLYAGTSAGAYRRVAAGDLNGDGEVDQQDLGILLSNYDKTAMTYEQGDIDSDGQVGQTDLGALLSVYGE